MLYEVITLLRRFPVDRPGMIEPGLNRVRGEQQIANVFDLGFDFLDFVAENPPLFLPHDIGHAAGTDSYNFV